MSREGGADHSDPNTGLYTSCRDSYGSQSGAQIKVGDTLWLTPCVTIKVENSAMSGGSVVDRYTVSFGGRDGVSGQVVVEDGSAAMFSDDSLPSTPPEPGSGATVVEFSIDNVCDIDAVVSDLVQIGDADGEGVADLFDNCSLAPNARQRDSNGDGFGNACDPDLNDDLVTNVLDLGALRLKFFEQGNLDADLNSDGVVNVLDLGILRQRFFTPPGPSMSVPDSGF